MLGYIKWVWAHNCGLILFYGTLLYLSILGVVAFVGYVAVAKLIIQITFGGIMFAVVAAGAIIPIIESVRDYRQSVEDERQRTFDELNGKK